MSPVTNFREFFAVHARVFRFFGVVPSVGEGRLSRATFAAVAAFLLLYWTGVVFSFLIDRHLNDKISVISNWIQMLANSIALTTTLGSTVLKSAEFEEIVQQFHAIDEHLLAIGHQIDYAGHLRRSKLIVFGYLGALGGLLAYDFFITVDKYQMTSVWYWAVSVTPLVVYSVGMYQAMFMIYWIKYRCALMNQVLKRIRGGTATPEKAARVHVLDVVVPRNQPLLVRQKSMDMNILSQLFSVMNDLCKLSRKIDEYYGLFFLASIGALFAITSIQVYYCYVTAISFEANLKYSVWTLMVSVNLVTVNLTIIVGITTVCENVCNEATRILQNFSALQIKQDVPLLSELSIWVHPMVSYMKFSAYGFFTIDYNMLCGFMTALITYLVVFIQFYALNGDKKVAINVREDVADTDVASR